LQVIINTGFKPGVNARKITEQPFQRLPKVSPTESVEKLFEIILSSMIFSEFYNIMQSNESLNKQKEVRNVHVKQV